MNKKIKGCLTLIRPYQWIKNLLLFSPVFFSGQITQASIQQVLFATVCFCLISSMGYILNDWIDRDRDAHHFQKKNRPFCTGDISGFDAVILSATLLCSLFLIGLIANLSVFFWVFAGGYAFLTVSYSTGLKRVIIFELFVISMGFVIRVFAGGAAAGISISSWLFLTVFFLSLLISVAKRLAELFLLGSSKAVLHRQSHQGYSIEYLKHLQWAAGSISLVVYSLYVVENKGIIVYSVIPAAYGVFRFVYLSGYGKGGDPIKALMEDKQLLVTTLIFFSFLIITIYL